MTDSTVNIDSKYPDGATINEYSNEFKRLGFNEIAEKLYDDKSVGFKALEEMDLPRPFGLTVDANEYLTDPDQYYDQMSSSLYYVNVLPKIRDLPKYTTYGKDRETTKQRVKDHITDKDIANYLVNVNEFFKPLYGGNIVVNPNMQVVCEFGPGDNSPYSKGNEVPAYQIKHNATTDETMYNFEDEELQAAALSAIKSVPYKISSWQTDFQVLPTTGYYEFVLYRHPTEAALKTAFVDYKDNPVYFSEGYEPLFESINTPTPEERMALSRVQKLVDGTDVKFTGISDVKHGVSCRTYEFTNNHDIDFGVEVINCDVSTPLQEIGEGESTIIGYLGGKGTLTVISRDDKGIESHQIYDFGPDTDNQTVQIKVGQAVQLTASHDQKLITFDVCEPKYTENRYIDLEKSGKYVLPKIEINE